MYCVVSQVGFKSTFDLISSVHYYSVALSEVKCLSDEVFSSYLCDVDL